MLEWLKKNKIHIILWTSYMLYEVVVTGLLLNNFGNPIIYLAHYSVVICFFYLHSIIILPLALKNRLSGLVLVPLFLVIELTFYSISQFLMAYFLTVIKLKTEVLKFDSAFVLRNLYRGILFVGYATGYYFLRNYIQERKRAQELEQDKLKAIIQHQQMQQELTNAQNAFLKAQINPHFLFNTLDFVYHNVNKHSPMAGEAVARLAEMMRFAIAAGEREQNIRLVDEIEQVENLIFLYQIRKNNGLAISFIYPEEALELKIIPLVLLTLVENVFKHGYLTSDEKDRAEIILAIDGEILRIETNNSIGRLQTLMSNKTGLKNVDERLGFAYGKNYAFSHEAKGNKFSVRLSIAISLLQYKPAVAKHATDIDII